MLMAVQHTRNWNSTIPIVPHPPHRPAHFLIIMSNKTTISFILTELHVSVDDDIRQATNTKSESKVQYNTGVFIVWDPIILQSLLQYKLYTAGKRSNE